MIEALCKEIAWAGQHHPMNIKTLYFGGGTPSLLKITELKKLIDTVHHHFGQAEIECTLEANPDDITTDMVQSWKNLGVNRLSIGLQSFKAQDLLWMNRAHNVDQSYACVKIAQQAGIENITVDLMYGLPELSDQEWRAHVETVAEMGVNHVSAYCLTIEERTALAKKVKAEALVPLDEDQQARQFEILFQTLHNHGLHQYEISNFAKKGFESKHNSAYWSGEHYIGIGPSAHSFWGAVRQWNVANNQVYMNAIEQQLDWFEQEELTSNNLFNELLLTGLRTVKGVEIKKLTSVLPLDDLFWISVNKFEKLELLINNGETLVLTPKGRLQADYIASELFKVND